MGAEKKPPWTDELRIMTVRQVAFRFGMKYDATLALLKRLDTECHGMLLKNMSPSAKVPRYGIALVALRRACPEWFGCATEPPGWQDRVKILERANIELAAEVERMSWDLDALKVVVGEMRKAS